MTIAGDTDDLISTSLWGESVIVVRNTPTYGGDGAPSDSWATVETVNADIQPIGSPDRSGSVRTVELGQVKEATHQMFLPASSGVAQGDRIRASGWSTGTDEYHVDAVLVFDDHVEILAHVVKGHA